MKPMERKYLINLVLDMPDDYDGDKHFPGSCYRHCAGQSV